MSGTHDSLAERYGAPTRARRALVAGLALVVIVPAAAWLVWATVENADPPIASQAITHEILDDHTAQVTVRFEYGDGPVAATCEARAIAHDKSMVGVLTFEPDPGQWQQTVEIATERRATTVDWIGCTAEGQPRPR